MQTPVTPALRGDADRRTAGLSAFQPSQNISTTTIPIQEETLPLKHRGEDMEYDNTFF